MSVARTHSRTTVLSVGTLSALTAAIVVAAMSFASSARAVSPPDVRLGTAAQFAVLAYDGVTNTGTTTVTGDIGSFPTTTVTDNGAILPPGNVRRGPDQVVENAKPDLAAAFGQAAGAQPDTQALPADIGGRTLVGGTYNQASALGLTGTVTLDGQNDPNSVFIIQVGSDFTTAPSSSVVLTRGAQACHVYWQIGNSAVFDTATSFIGNVLAYQDISANTGATFQGRLLTTDGAVTLDTNTITLPACAAVVTPSPSTPTPAPTVTTPATPAPTRAVPVRATPRPTDSSPSRDADGGSGTDDSDSDSDGSSGTDGGDSFADADGSTTTSTPGLPNTGGPPWFLAPLGGLALLAGMALVAMARMRRGVHRA